MDQDELCGRVSADHFILLLKYHHRSDILLRQKEADARIADYMKETHDQLLITRCGICCVEDVQELLAIDGYIDRSILARSTVKAGEIQNYMIYNEAIRQHFMDEKSIENHMMEAFEKRQFFVNYQPKVDMKTNTIASAEALVRWRFEDGTIIAPDRFIPVFERKLMISQLDQYVMDCVCSMLRKRLDAHQPVVPIAVNVSRLQFYDSNFVEQYVQIRDHYHIPPKYIEIEFTESIVFNNIHLLISIVNELKRHQFKCSIDDFGKGYSSLSLLKDLPVDYIKIDSYFFMQSEDTKRDYALIEGIINMIHKLDMKSVAEGIESQEQVEILRRFGCDYIQGFIFYKPLELDVFEQLLET